MWLYFCVQVGIVCVGIVGLLGVNFSLLFGRLCNLDVISCCVVVRLVLVIGCLVWISGSVKIWCGLIMIGGWFVGCMSFLVMVFVVWECCSVFLWLLGDFLQLLCFCIGILFILISLQIMLVVGVFDLVISDVFMLQLLMGLLCNVVMLNLLRLLDIMMCVWVVFSWLSCFCVWWVSILSLLELMWIVLSLVLVVVMVLVILVVMLQVFISSVVLGFSVLIWVWNVVCLVSLVGLLCWVCNMVNVCVVVLCVGILQCCCVVKLDDVVKLVIYVVWVVVIVVCLWVCCEFILISGCFLVVLIMCVVVEVIVVLWLKIDSISVLSRMYLVKLLCIESIGDLGKYSFFLVQLLILLWNWNL